MGYLSTPLHAPETDELTLPSSESGEWRVWMKRHATYGDSRAAQSALLKVSAGQNAEMVTEMEVGAFIGTLTAHMIVSWNLTDENDQPLAVSPENLDRLPDEDGEFLAVEAQKRKGGRRAEEQSPFPKPSGQPSTGTKSKTPK